MQYKCINVSFFVQNALLKRSCSYENFDLDSLVVSVNVISLLFDIVANYAVVLKYDIND